MHEELCFHITLSASFVFFRERIGVQVTADRQMFSFRNLSSSSPPDNCCRIPSLKHKFADSLAGNYCNVQGQSYIRTYGNIKQSTPNRSLMGDTRLDAFRTTDFIQGPSGVVAPSWSLDLHYRARCRRSSWSPPSQHSIRESHIRACFSPTRRIRCS